MEPIATGDLASSSFGELLHSVYARELTGSFVLAETEEERHCIWFLEGWPRKVKLSSPLDLVGAVMVEQGALRDDQVTTIVEHAQTSGLLFGAAAVQLGLAVQEVVQRALAAQTLKRLVRMFRMQSGLYGFYVENFLASYGGEDNPPVDPLSAIAAGVRSSYDLIRLTRLVDPLRGKPIALSPGTDPRRFGFNEQETQVLGGLSQPRTLEEIAKATRTPPLVLRSVVHCLQVAGMLVVGEAREGDAPPSKPKDMRRTSQIIKAAEEKAQAAATSTPAPAVSDRRAEVEHFLAAAPEMNYFQLLGVPPEASPEEVQRAFVERARKYHPDKARGELADLRDKLADLMARISVARETLADPERRAAYHSTLEFASARSDQQAPESEDEVVHKILDAEKAFQKGRILFKTNKLEEAESLVRSAAEANPQQGDYLALLAWIEAKRRPRERSVDDLIERLQAAVALSPKSEQAHLYLANLLHQTGRNREAFAEYREVLLINEHNVDAGRMVRLLRARQSEVKGAKQADRKGLMGFLLKDVKDVRKK